MNTIIHGGAHPRPYHTTTSDGHLLTVKDVAEKLKVTTRTIRNYLVRKRRPLPHSKPQGIVYINSNDLNQWLTQR